MEKKFKPAVKTFLLSNGESGASFFGPGMMRLLDEIDKTKNVRKSCENMGMSYSKGWKLLRAVEECAGFPVTERRQGGKGGGEARLTSKGKDFLEKYRDFSKKCEKEASRVFNEIWS
ncbi:MAG: LysR family transcriptional regulator [Spirochaetaceae bacterium]|jgi:molybdate transport system regulatory protein|nr:LysR family transcriptional regulator [Spirochaetaceae bacterium]